MFGALEPKTAIKHRSLMNETSHLTDVFEQLKMLLLNISCIFIQTSDQSKPMLQNPVHAVHNMIVC